MAKDDPDAFDEMIDHVRDFVREVQPHIAVKFFRIMADDIERELVPLAKVSAEERRRLH